jgi:GT2 family glycosyltransferase/glycosyltransferase involved in cell wall biosynthesis
MSHQENVNSNHYWDHRFENDWEANGGKEQSRFFARVAIDAMPQWLVHAVRWNNLTVCDWGCAQGDGTETLARMLSWDITGIDFSGPAIEQARQRYKTIRFSHENLLDKPKRPAFDMIFSSNTLEHFPAPWEVFNEIANYASRFIVLLLPYREFDRHVEHEVTFDAINIPISPSADWVLVHRSVNDTRFREPSYWHGDQVLLVYARTTRLAAQYLTLSDLNLYRTEPADEISVFRQQLTQAEAQYAGALKAAPWECRLAQSHAESMQARLDAEKSRADAAMAQITAAEARHAGELEAARRECQRAQSLAESVQARLETEKSRADAAMTHIADAEVRHAGEVEAARRECHLAQSHAESVQTQLEAEKSRVDDLTAQVASADACAAAATAIAAARLSEFDEERSKVQQLTDENTRLVAAAHQNIARIHFLEYREQSLVTEVKTVLATKSWRMTAPLRMVRKTPDWMKQRISDINYAYIHGGIRNVAYRALTYVPKHLKRRTVRPSVSAVLHDANVTPPAKDAQAARAPRTRRSMPDVFVFSIIDWHFRIQRPQHLSREFARAGHRVYFFSNHFEHSNEPGFSVERLDNVLPLYQVKLKVNHAPSIYFATPTAGAISQILAGIRLFLNWSDTERSWSLVQHAYWYPIARSMQSECITYDCMDHHEGFGNVPREVLELEERMMKRADLLVATSSWLEELARRHNRHVEVIRNAGQYTDFCDAPAERFVDPRGRKIIGYYGAIAEWFDTDLVARIAQAFPDTLVLLVGADSVDVASKLKAFTNVEMTGEVPYSRLPYYLYAFDICILPFRVMPLTLATNPVKVYEYLGAGRSVVSIDLPEMGQFGELVRVANTHEGFIEKLRQAMTALPDSTNEIDRRKAFAAGQTWTHRIRNFRQAIEALPRPKVSVIVLTYNNLELTKNCLDSLAGYSDDADLEIVVVDNASSDGSPAYLSSWEASRPSVKLILNNENRGFAAGNNQGLAAASGDYLVILNNDTVVTRGWARRMVNHLRNNPEIGILGPVTNNIGNEARVNTRYTTLEDMHLEADEITKQNLGKWFELDTVAFFCAMLPRSTYESCGSISEDYGAGFFEDDDYCRRAQANGLIVACAEDVFVHHQLSASFNQLGAERKRVLFETNRAIYESKWGPWIPHRYRDAPRLKVTPINYSVNG